MHALLLLDMAASDRADAPAVQYGENVLSYSQLLEAAWAVPDIANGSQHLAYVASNSLAFPVALFGAGAAEIPFIPVNYRLPDEQISALLGHHDDVLVIAETERAGQLRAMGHRVITREEFEADALAGTGLGEVPFDAETVALLLYTSGTTAAPKAAVLRHRHLTSYVISSVEFGSAADSDAVLVSVPPYHIAGVANLLSNVYLGRRIVYLNQFDAKVWLDTVRAERISHAMVVPTMLARICDVLEGSETAQTPTLAALSYGGARTPINVLERVMKLFPDTGLTNAYGLTETSSTIAVLGPDEHRAAALGEDPDAWHRLSSVGKLLPSIEVEIRGENGEVLSVGEIGDIWVRGEQVSGEYEGKPSLLDDQGWFATRDRGWVDSQDYLFVEGRSDDTIIRGGENIAPAEIEEVLQSHPKIASCAVVGVPDNEWGQRIAAVIVLKDPGDPGEMASTAQEIKAFVRSHLRGSKTPDVISFVTELPYTETGKLLRREVLATLLSSETSL